MAPKETHRLSLFSQNLDRVAFLAYFLGGVVPLAGLGLVVHVFVLPQLPERAAALGAVGSVLGLGCLSLAAFLALRRVTRATLARLDVENHRLESLLEVSVKLADARFADEVHRSVAGCAAQLCGTPVALVVARDPSKPEDAPLQLVATSGQGAVEAWHRLSEELSPLLGPTLEAAIPALRSDGGPEAAFAAVPIAGAQELPPAALLVVDERRGARLDAAHLRLLQTAAALASVSRSNADLRDAQRNFFVHVTELILAALDGHTQEPAGHARRVAQLAVALGRELGLGDARLERLHFAGLLHDVGMLKLDTRRAQSAAALRSHPQLGHRMLSRIKLWEDLAPFVLHHHEHWDGQGQPEGLSGEDIPLEARILGLAEAFDSMLGGSTTEPGRPAAEVLGAIERGAGSAFDPQLATTFLALAREGRLESLPRDS